MDFSPAAVILILFIAVIGCVIASYVAQLALSRLNPAGGGYREGMPGNAGLVGHRR